MQYFKESPRLRPVENGNNRQSLLLLIGAFILALLTGIVADLFGEVAGMLSLLFLFFIAVAISNYRYGILITIVLLPISFTNLAPREVFGVTGLNPLNVTLLFSVISLSFAWLIRPGKIVFPKWPRYFWLYVGAVGLAALQGLFHASSIPPYLKALYSGLDSAGGYFLGAFLKPMLIIVTAFLLSVVVRNARRPSLCLIPLFLSAIVLPIVVIVYVAVSGESLSNLSSSDASARGFLSSLGIHANELGLMFNMAFALTIFCFFSVSGAFEKWMLGIAAIILVIAIALTFSRGAYVGLLSVVGYLLLSQRRFRTTLVVLAVIAAGAFLVPEAVIERAATGLASRNVEDIGAGRVGEIWLPLLPEILSSPLVGHGLSSILWSDAAQHQTILPVGHPHSAYLGALLDFGILGTMIIFLFFRHMWQLFTKLAKHASDPVWRGFFRGATACILLLLVQGLTDDSFAPGHTQTLLWLSYGIAMGLVARARGVKWVVSNRIQTQNASY